MAAVLAVFASQAGAAVPSAKAASKPKAVVISGPAGSSTSHFLDDAKIIANQAENAGMNVVRIFHPHATWQKVLNNIQGANLVIYMGHGNGWPSPYAPFQERTKDGFGLDGYDGAGSNSVTYYGGNVIRQNVKLAHNAITLLVHLCYASGNGEPGMAIPGWSTASQRVDNFAAAFLAVGSRSVFSFGWFQEYNIPSLLMSSNKTMEQIFEIPHHGYPSGWIGWNDKYIDSQRTPGTRMHLDPSKTYGFYRALTGSFGMTASDWRSGSGGGGSGDTTGTASGGSTFSGATLNSVDVTSTDGGATTDVNTATTANGTLPSFHPNGDGLQDKLIVTQTVSAGTYLQVKVANSSGNVVKKFTVWAKSGSSTSDWNGKDSNGNYVPEGVYTMSYTPKDSSGNLGTTRSFKVVVLNAVAFTSSTDRTYASDGDDLAATATVSFTTNQTATVSVKVLDQAGNIVRTLQSATSFAKGSYTTTWGGRDGNGNYVKDGAYRLVINSRTGFGSYKEERPIWVGAFSVSTSTLTPSRGGGITFTVYSTEPLSAAPTLDISQPGLATYTVKLSKVDTDKYKVSVTLKTGGSSGTMGLVVNGVDSNGQDQSYTTSLPLR